MAALTVDTVSADMVVFTETSVLPGIAGANITRGQVIRMDGTTGRWALAAGDTAANAGTRRYFALRTVKSGQALSGCRLCTYSPGASTLDGLSFGVPIYLSDTPGAITAVAAESTTATIMGYVIRAGGGGTLAPDRLVDVL